MTAAKLRIAAADVAVVVVNYNTRELLARCLESLSGEGAAEVVVVDNASQDGSAAYIRDRVRDVRVITNERNIGYGAAANQAIRNTSAPFVLLLNADTEVRPGAVAALARYAANAPRAGIIAPLIVDARGVGSPSHFPFPGTMDWLLENEPLSPIVRRVPSLRRRALSFGPSRSARTVPWVLGCAMLLRREAFEAIGGFEESYFMYYEEVDLCRRMWEAGREVHFTPDTRVMHVGGASTSQVRTAMLVRHFHSTVEYYRRHCSGPQLAFWLAAMHLKRIALLARDSARLLTASDPEERQILLEQRQAWLATAIHLPRGRHHREVPR